MKHSTWIDAGPRGSHLTTGNKVELTGPTLRVLDSKNGLKFEVAPGSVDAYRAIRDWAARNMKDFAK